MNKMLTPDPYQFSLDQNGLLQAEQVGIKDLVQEFGSPLNIISQTQLTNNIRALHKSFSDSWGGPVRVLPAIKCNTSLALCKILAAETEGCDLFSEGELLAALKTGFKPAFLSLNGNSKLTADMRFLEEAIQQGVRLTLDDKAEFDAIETISKKLNVKARVRLRVRPSFPDMNQPTDFLPYVAVPSEIASFLYKAGIPTEDVIPLGKKVLKSEHVELTGLHLHLGRHAAGMDFWKTAMQGYARLIAELKESWNGWEPGELDIGGGYSQQFDPMKSVKEALSEHREFGLLSKLTKISSFFGKSARYKVVSSLIKMSHKQARAKRASVLDLSAFSAPTLQEYGKTAGYLKTALEKHGIDSGRIVLELEPGRALFGGAAIHVCQVSFIKKQTVPIPWSWVVTDTTDYWLLGGGHEPNHPYLVEGKPLENYSPDQRMIADIVGKSCNADRIIPDGCVPADIETGDLIAFIGTGAYQEMQSSNFNFMGRPATVLVNGGLAGLIRRRETNEDVFDREMIPDWLT